MAIPRILIVDDHNIVRRGVRRILKSQDHWEVAGEAADGQEALRVFQEIKPDAVLMDITMPKLNGFEATRAAQNTVNYPRFKPHRVGET